jgi:hypothetical protein
VIARAWYVREVSTTGTGAYVALRTFAHILSVSVKTACGWRRRSDRSLQTSTTGMVKVLLVGTGTWTCRR